MEQSRRSLMLDFWQSGSATSPGTPVAAWTSAELMTVHGPATGEFVLLEVFLIAQVAGRTDDVEPGSFDLEPKPESERSMPIRNSVSDSLTDRRVFGFVAKDSHANYENPGRPRDGSAGFFAPDETDFGPQWDT